MLNQFLTTDFFPHRTLIDINFDGGFGGCLRIRRLMGLFLLPKDIFTSKQLLVSSNDASTVLTYKTRRETPFDIFISIG